MACLVHTLPYRVGPGRTDTPKGGENLIISLSLVVVLGVAVWVLHRYAGLKLWHAVVCILFGFYLAAPAAARATLTAADDGERDPLYYLRDELTATGHLPASGERPW